MNAAVEAMPALGELNVANAFLGDRRALDDAWERDGYWYFRDVLDQEALTRLRAVYLDLLKSLGVIDRNATEAIYNGASMANYPPNMEVLVATRAWQPFVSHPAVHAFFRQVLGDEPFWIPISEYRATPPNGDRARNRFDYPHQDGFYNQGIPFRICWIPLATIDASIGGFAIGLTGYAAIVGLVVLIAVVTAGASRLTVYRTLGSIE